ncbi:phage tail tape measure protein [Pseudomonas fluorescens]|jgi:lambda family phage tail tape measure protein|uniref:Prophage tail length tape measure protein n=1 Tax=Pseudomonas fluorescens TaxID=294 RepID=A0A109KI46_PSEFL|nr:phage tail tape measure protein [Pseudomonas fluorescens]KWV69655.1 Prophage tail length tape measure protein [Pseudomonas fluorescens]
MAQTSRLVLEIDSRDAEQKAADTRKALEALEGVGLRVKPAMEKAGAGMESIGKGAEKATKSVQDQRDEIDQLLGSINPLTRKMNELEKQELALAKAHKAGKIETDTYIEYQQKITATRNELTRFSDSLTRTGNTAKQTAAALRGVPAQFTDIAVSLQGGQAPLTVLLQQGGQLKDMFGGVGPAAKALGGYVLGLVNPFTVAAAAVGVLGLAYFQGSKEADAYRNALILSGNAAGTSAGAIGSMAANVSKSVGTIKAASEVLAQLAASSKIPASSFEMIATAALKMEQATGKAASQTVAEFEKLAKDPVKYSKELNEQYGYLTASTYAQIEALSKQGDQQAAANFAEKAYAEAVDSRAELIRSKLGLVETAWDDVKSAAKGAWDAVLDIGREDTFEQKLVKLEDRLNRVRNAKIPTIFDDNPNLGELASGENGAQSDITDLYVQKAEDDRRAAAKAELLRLDKESIANQEKLSEALKSSASNADKLKARYAEIDKQIASASRRGTAYSETEIKQLRDAAAKQFADPKPKAYTENAGQRMLDEARQRYAVLQQQSSLIGLQADGTRSLGAEAKKLLELEQQIADLKDKKTLTATQKQLLVMADLNLAQQKQNAALEKENELRKIATEEVQKLAAFQTNLASQLSKAQIGLDNNLAGMGMGDQMRQRLQEQLSIQQQYQTQLDALEQQHNEGRISDSLYGKETEALRAALQQRLTMQQGYYTAVDQAQSDWSLGASSALQTYAEQANDVAGQTRNLFTNAFGNMEDAVVNFVKTGKLSFKDFADGVISDLIRIQIRQAAAGFLGMAFGAITGGGGAALGPAVMTGSSQTISRVGFSGGGYTGDGGKFEPKGVVHGGEFVVKKEVVSQPGAREFLERMNANSNGYADGGHVNPTPAAASSSTTQSIATNGGSPTITQQFSFQGNPDDATISLVKDAAYQGAKGGYEMVMRDLKQNGPIRQLIARR